MEYIKQILFDSTSCSHGGKTYCESCKSRTVKVVIGGFTIVCSTFFGSSLCIGSCINYYFTGLYDIELTLALGFGCGALVGTMLGTSLCVSAGLLQIDEYAAKQAGKQAEKERYGIYVEKLNRYNAQHHAYYSGQSRDYPIRPTL
jgi:hypothetical protein